MGTSKLQKYSDIAKRTSATVVLPLMSVLIFFYSTSLNKLFGEGMEMMQKLLGVCIVITLIFLFLSFKKSEWITYIKSNYLIGIYFVIRLVSFIKGDFDLTILRSMVFEGFLLLGVSSTIIGEFKERKFYFSFLVVAETILSILSVLIYIAMPYIEGNLKEFIIEYTMVEESLTSALFVNPNTAGIIGAYVIIVLCDYFGRHREKNKRLIAGLLILWNLFFVWFQRCRSAEVALIVIGIILILKHFSCKLNQKKIIIAVLTMCICTMGFVYIIELYSIDKNQYTITETEEVFNKIASNRYAIWKGCIIEQKNHLLFGAGSLPLEQENRKMFFEDNKAYSWRIQETVDLGAHNGYVGMISATGWLGFLIFIAILYRKIKKSQLLNKGNWYLLIIYTLIVNLFESLLILDQFFLGFYLLLLLEADDNQNCMEIR